MKRMNLKTWLTTLILVLFVSSGNVAQARIGETDSADGKGKVLVVYYSATGTTAKAASYITAALDADVLELKCVKPYSGNELDWTDKSSRVCKEYADESLRKVELVSTTVAGWDSYDTVFIGYPIWWGIAAWPVNGFVEANDFTGKTVIPFCTAYSSGIGESGKLLEKLAGTGHWLQGTRFASTSFTESDVQAWLKQIGLINK